MQQKLEKMREIREGERRKQQRREVTILHGV